MADVPWLVCLLGHMAAWAQGVREGGERQEKGGEEKGAQGF
jgi:hypothetical protein